MPRPRNSRRSQGKAAFEPFLSFRATFLSFRGSPRRAADCFFPNSKFKIQKFKKNKNRLLYFFISLNIILILMINGRILPRARAAFRFAVPFGVPFAVPFGVLFVVLLFRNRLCNTLKAKALRANFVVLSVVSFGVPFGVPFGFRSAYR